MIFNYSLKVIVCGLFDCPKKMIQLNQKLHNFNAFIYKQNLYMEPNIIKNTKRRGLVKGMTQGKIAGLYVKSER